MRFQCASSQRTSSGRLSLAVGRGAVCLAACMTSKRVLFTTQSKAGHSHRSAEPGSSADRQPSGPAGGGLGGVGRQSDVARAATCHAGRGTGEAGVGWQGGQRRTTTRAYGPQVTANRTSVQLWKPATHVLLQERDEGLVAGEEHSGAQPLLGQLSGDAGVSGCGTGGEAVAVSAGSNPVASKRRAQWGRVCVLWLSKVRWKLPFSAGTQPGSERASRGVPLAWQLLAGAAWLLALTGHCCVEDAETLIAHNLHCIFRGRRQCLERGRELQAGLAVEAPGVPYQPPVGWLPAARWHRPPRNLPSCRPTLTQLGHGLGHLGLGLGLVPAPLATGLGCSGEGRGGGRGGGGGAGKLRQTNQGTRCRATRTAN